MSWARWVAALPAERPAPPGWASRATVTVPCEAEGEAFWLRVCGGVAVDAWRRDPEAPHVYTVPEGAGPPRIDEDRTVYVVFGWCHTTHTHTVRFHPVPLRVRDWAGVVDSSI